jgi:hypothetical protein
MVSHPYVVNPTRQAIDTISERLCDTKSGKITTSILGDATNGIIQHSSVGYATPVNNDWIATRRYIFLLKVTSIDMVGAEINSYIQGYTEYDGITNTGNIDGNMTHFINNVIETNSITIQTPLGIIRKEKLHKIYNVFSPQGQEDCFTQRPGDILQNIETLNMTNVMSNMGAQHIQGYHTQNFMNPFNNNIIASTVDNGIASEYLSRILTTGVLSTKSKDIHLNSYEIGEQSTVDTRIPEPSINENRFIKYLNSVQGFRVPRERFNFNQLMSIDNTIYNRFKVIHLNKDYVNPVMSATPETGDYWTGQDPVTVKAYSLIEASTAMAIKYGFNKLYFTASNMSNPTGLAEVFITNFNSFINLEEHDFNFLLEIFKDKFITDIFLTETNGGTIPMYMEGYIDLLGTSKIHLSYAGFPSNWYTIPTTANSLFSSVVTVNSNAFNETSYNLGQVIDALTTNQSMNQTYY